MNLLMELKAFLKSFLWDRPINWILILFVSIAGFGLKLITISYNNDMCLALYSNPLKQLEQKRWGAAFLASIGLIDRHIPFWSDLIGLAFIIAAALLFAFLFFKASDKNISHSSLLIFILIFISYPLNLEIYIYPSEMIINGISYCLVAVSLILILQNSIQSSKYSWILPVLPLSFAVSTYESFCSVYLATSLMLIYYMLYTEKITTYSEIFRKGCVFLGYFIGALILRQAVISLLSFFVDFPNTTGAAKEILWLDANNSVLKTTLKLISRLCYYFGYNGSYYFAIFSFWFAVLLFLLLIAAKRGFKIKLAVILFLMMIASFMFSLLLGTNQPYRICQSFAVFVGFAWLMLYQYQVQRRAVIGVVIASMIFLQVKEMNLIINFDRVTSEKAIILIHQLGHDIKMQYEDTRSKRIIVLGEISRGIKPKDLLAPPWMSYFPATLISDQIGRTDLNNSPQFIAKMKYFNDLTVTRIDRTEMQFWQDLIAQNKQPAWPRPGSIKQYDNTIVIYLGDPAYTDAENVKQYWKNIIRKLK